MKLLVLILALGLSAVAYSQDLSNDAIDSVDSQDFINHVLDDDFEEDEIVDMDDALQKARMLKAMARMIAEAESRDLLNPKKRFIGSFFESVKKAIVGAANKVGDFFKGAWEKAKSAFTSVVHGIDFKSVVNKVIPFIHSGMSVAGCQKAISAAASAILGPAAALVGTVSKPLCDAALSKLQDIAG